jgi:hypothetical protein
MGTVEEKQVLYEVDIKVKLPRKQVEVQILAKPLLLRNAEEEDEMTELQEALTGKMRKRCQKNSQWVRK